MAQGFAEALRRHSKEVADLEGEQAAEFLRLLKALRDQLKGRLEATLDPSQSLRAFDLSRVLAETESGILTLEARANVQYKAAAAESADLAVGHIGDELERLSRAFDRAPLDITLDAAKILADPVRGLLANHFESSVKRYGIYLLNGVRQRLFLGLRTGDPFGQIVRDVSGEQGPFGQVGKANAERLVRTEVSGAYGSAAHQGIASAAKQVPGLKKVWLHVGSYRCDVCMPIHGTTRPMNGTWTIRQGKTTKKVAHAPAHPNCSCRVSAMKQSWSDGMKKLGYLKQETSESSPSQL